MPSVGKRLGRVGPDSRKRAHYQQHGLQPRREDLVDEVRGASSRGQEGRECKLNYILDPETTRLPLGEMLGPRASSLLSRHMLVMPRPLS